MKALPFFGVIINESPSAGVHDVLEVWAATYRVRSQQTGEIFTIYAAKCRPAIGVKNKAREEALKAAQQIGIPKPKPGKK
jgi:hypothetical protein